jgi:hypothetical protein
MDKNDSSDKDMKNEKPNGGFIPIIKKNKIQKRHPLSGIQQKDNIISIMDILKAR